MSPESRGELIAQSMADELEKIAFKGLRRFFMNVSQPGKLKNFDDLIRSEDKVLRSFQEGQKFGDKKLLSQAKTRQKVHNVRMRNLEDRSKKFLRQQISNPEAYAERVTKGEVPSIDNVKKVLTQINKNKVPRFFRPTATPGAGPGKSMDFDKIMKGLGVATVVGGTGYLGLQGYKKKQLAEAQNPYKNVYGY